MPSTTRIPRSNGDLNTYMINTNAHLLNGTPDPNWKRVGLLETEMTQWTTLKTEFSELYMQYADKTNGRTKGIMDHLEEKKEEILDFDRSSHILDRIAASPNVTVYDLDVFNIKNQTSGGRGGKVPVITENVTVTLSPVGGGMISVKCYSISGQRAHIIDEADCVQYAYTTGDTPPASAVVAGLVYGLSSKAAFTLSLGPDQAMKILYIYFRWYNTRHSEAAGPWCPCLNTGIL